MKQSLLNFADSLQPYLGWMVTAPRATALENNAAKGLTPLSNYAGPKELSVATINVRQMKLKLSKNNYYREDKLMDFLIEGDFDIVFLQEYFTSPFNIYEDISEQYPHILVAPATGKTWFDSGLAILSKYPIFQSRFFTYLESAGADRLANKGLLAGYIQVSPDNQLVVLNTHMQARDEKGYEEALDSAHAFQCGQLDVILKGFYDGPSPKIFAGDFNNHTEGRRKNLRHATRQWTDHSTYEGWIDKIYTQNLTAVGGMTTELVGDTEISDHNPVVHKLNWAEEN